MTFGDENGVASASDATEHVWHSADEDMDTSDPATFVTELQAGAGFFRADDVVTLRIGPRKAQFRIHSIPKAELEEALLVLKPKLPPVRDPNTKQLVEDTESPGYRRWLMTFAYLKVLLGLSALTLRDTTGAIVWQVPGEVRDLRAAVSALMGTGITTQHVETLTTAIDRLSQETDDAQQETLLGN